jgi:hypothetical protein
MIVFDASGVPRVMRLTAEPFAIGALVVVHTHDKVYVWSSAPAEDRSENEGLSEVIDECYLMSGRYLPVEKIQRGSAREAKFRDFLRLPVENGMAFPT